jgi:anti-sigma factor RsiW
VCEAVPMNCTQFEALLADYLDGTLAAIEHSALEEHAAACLGCREFMQDATAGARLLAGTPEIEVPPDLVTRIAYQAPNGRLRHPLDQPGLLSRLASKWLQPLLQPKLAMGMAMTVLSFAMLQRCTGIQVQHIQAADLSPVRIWDGLEDRAIRVKDRAVKYYENIRLVYDIESRLRDMEAPPQTSSQPPSRSRAQSGTGVHPTNRNDRPSEGARKK